MNRFRTSVKNSGRNPLAGSIKIMKLRTILSSVLVAVCVVTGNAEKNNTANHHSSVEAHRQAHARLANVNTKLDMSSINNRFREDIEEREAMVEGRNPETMQMMADLLKESRKHIGKPYRRGSKGPKAFDCSGFTSYVYSQFGVKLSPSSSTQATQGKKVERGNLREGDLVFFSSPRSGRSIGHVGIVVSADNESGDFKFIHASTSRGIKIDECKGYYAKRYVGARRVVD